LDIIFNDKPYILLEPYRNRLFQPSKYDVSPRIISIICRDGFHCTFEIFDEQLKLKTLNLIGENFRYPPINNIKPIENKMQNITSYKELNLDIIYSRNIYLAEKLENQPRLWRGSL
jgi:hypothetical protein